jgi:hypothetical protein
MQTVKSPSQTLARLHTQPHRSQLGSKMIKGKENNMGKVEDMNDINQKKEKSQGKMFKKQHKAQK